MDRNQHSRSVGASRLLHCGFKVKRYLAGQQKSALSLEEDQEPQLRRI